jgi:hypothetical protein
LTISSSRFSAVSKSGAASGVSDMKRILTDII